jgi:signal transduction histidine kinase
MKQTLQGRKLLEKVANTKVMSAEEKIQEQARLLETLHTELTTFNNIIVNDYRETLKNAYISLEFIISHDAGKLSDAGKANVRRAQAGIQKMRLLTEDIISYMQIPFPEGEGSPVDLNAILQNVISDLNVKIRDTKTKIEGDRLPTVCGFQNLLSLLFFHLIDNAIKFHRKNAVPVIEITCRQDVAPYNSYPLLKGKNYERVSISDNGIGFDKKDAENIFKLFYRLHDKSRYKGSGLGLAICKKIMHLHNGFITAESVPGKGSTFNCFFPL